MTRTFGIEIEAFGATRDAVVNAFRAVGLNAAEAFYTNSDASYWRIKTDASISGENGFEVVSPILTDMADVQKCCDALEEVGAKVNRSTGLHVHVGAGDLNIASWKNMCKRYRDNEVEIDAFMPRSRRENNQRFIASIRNVSDAAIDRATNVQGLVDAFGTRYVKLNVSSFLKHGTVEFRHHSGTTDFTKISKWINFCLNFVQASVVTETSSKIKDAMVITEARSWNPHSYGSDAYAVYNCLMVGDTVAQFLELVEGLGLNDAKKGQRYLRSYVKSGRVALEGFSAVASGAMAPLWTGQELVAGYFAERTEDLS
jgi:hypothetical protein